MTTDKTIQNSADYLDIESQQEYLQSTGSWLIDKAKSMGAIETELALSKDIGLSVEVRNRSVDTIEYNQDNNFAITVYFGKNKGTAGTSDLSRESLQDTLNAACQIAKYTQPDPHNGLADANLMAKEKVDLDLDHPIGITADKAIEIAIECESAGLDYSDKISLSEGAGFSSHRNLRYYANSHGFYAVTPSTIHSLSCSLIAKDAKGMQRDSWYSLNRKQSLMESSKTVGVNAAQKVLKRLDSKKIGTRKCPVLMIPEVSRGLIQHFCSAIQGSSLYRQSSFLLNSLGNKVFPEFLSFYEEPLLPSGLASTWYDNEGIATRSQYILQQGKVNTYLLNSYSARRLGLEPGGHGGGVHNLKVLFNDGESEQNFETLVKTMNSGLIVTSVMGQGVNLVTGDYSRGASGFWVENGQIQHFVEEITIAGNLNEMFANLVAVGNDYDYRSSYMTGSWLLENMTIAGN
ncbi:MAG: metalloprotease PmbA [Gammaproteobacteria bacterium]|nr:metalloprotease PmbA [Gammaproteobacteria bacterium]MDH5628537.1 metalloprotease PmbA [Gammaproteobacteria bacterium]